jgi:hypothetical protein
MKSHVYRQCCRSLGSIGACVVLAVAITTPSIAQEKTVTQTAGVDNTKMGAYRALAQLSLEAFQKGDHAAAAEFARILERTWDAGEEDGGKGSLMKTNKNLFEKTDKAMDQFIKPIMQYQSKIPDEPAVRAAYENFLSNLRQAD